VYISVVYVTHLLNHDAENNITVAWIEPNVISLVYTLQYVDTTNY